MNRHAVHFVDVATRSDGAPERTICDRAGVTITHAVALTTCVHCQRLLALAEATILPVHPWSPSP